MPRCAFIILAVLSIAVCLCPAAAKPGQVEIKNAAQPQLAVAADGRICLAYGFGDEIFFAGSGNDGESFGEPVKVATVPELMLGMRRGPRIAAYGERITVTVIARELLAFTSADGGKSWAGPVTINDVASSAREGLHDLAVAPDGDLFVTWLDLRNGSMELWSASSADGGLTWAKNARVYKSTGKSICECCHPNAAFDEQGNLAIMWRNSIGGARDMWFTNRPKGAYAFTTPHKLGNGTWILNACPMDGGEIVALGRGQFGAVWQRNGEVFFSSSGGAETRFGKGAQPVAIQLGDQLLAVWQQKGSLMSLQGLDSQPGLLASNARFSSLVSLPGGKGAVLAYETRSKEGAPIVIITRF